MKCLCGYYHIDITSEWDVERFAENNNLSEEDVKKNNGEDEFKRLCAVFEKETYRGREHDRVSLYVCPKCGTVRMED